MIVDSAVYRSGSRLDISCAHGDYRQLREVASAEGGFVWVGLLEPSADELGTVAKAFDLHPLAVEDALSAHQRPKVETYDASLFLVLKTLWYIDDTDAVETGEIHLFVGPDFIVSVRHGQGSELASARRALESQQSVLTHGPSAVVYGVCDRVVDEYEHVLDELQTDVDEVEHIVRNDADTIFTWEQFDPWLQRIQAAELVALASLSVALRGEAGINQLCGLVGYQLPIPASTLKTLYKTKADYQARVERRLAELERQGWSLPLYHNLILGDAAKVAF